MRKGIHTYIHTYTEKKKNLLARLAVLENGLEGHLQVTLGKEYRGLYVSRVDGDWAIRIWGQTGLGYIEVCLLSLKWRKTAV